MRFEDRLQERLRDLAGSAEPWDDPIPVVLERAAAQRRASAAPHRRWRNRRGVRPIVRVAASILLIAALGAGLGAGIWQLGRSTTNSSSPHKGAGGAARGAAPASAGGATASRSAAAGGAPLPGPNCLPPAVSSGPGSGTAILAVRVQRSASGRITGVRPVLHAGRPAITSTGPIRVILLAGTQVVGSKTRTVPRARSLLPVVPLPSSNCTARPAAVPAGAYTVVVSIGYRTGAGTTGTLVSRPVPITVR
ncbi:MAG: hypothetical protein ACR2F6_05545 [Mycobacteriales bacterium]